MLKIQFSLLMLLSSILTTAQSHIEVLTESKDSSKVVVYKEKDEVIKIYRYTKDGVREGLSEEWNRDIYEWYHFTFLYKDGVLLEITTLTSDGQVMNKRVFKDGKEVEYTNLSPVKTKDRKPVYFRTVYNRQCGYIQYRIVDNIIVDSVYVTGQ